MMPITHKGGSRVPRKDYRLGQIRQNEVVSSLRCRAHDPRAEHLQRLPTHQDFKPQERIAWELYL